MVLSILLFPQLKPLSSSTPVTAFEFHKGINISAWLSQTGMNASEMAAYFTKKDFDQLASIGFDHLRLPLDEKYLYNNDGSRNAETFTLIHNVIGWCKEANMRVILDCHDLKISRNLKPNKNQKVTLWESKEEQDNFVQLWKKLSGEFKKYPNTLVAYELLNEPVAPTPEEWNLLSARVISELRQLEPLRILFLGSNKFNSVTTFPELKVPPGDPNIILSFHFYHPGLLTHYTVATFENNETGIDIPLNYPGRLIPTEKIKGTLTPKQQETIKVQQGTFNRERLLEKMENVLKKAKETGLRIHCGEFGSNFKYPDHDLQLRWMQDLIANFKSKNIPYSVWGYRKSFGVFDDNRAIKDQRYLDAIVK